MTGARGDDKTPTARTPATRQLLDRGSVTDLAAELRGNSIRARHVYVGAQAVTLTRCIHCLEGTAEQGTFPISLAAS